VRKGTPRLPATWREYRHDNGDFKQWLHLWQISEHHTAHAATLNEYTAPLPWVWDEPLDGDMILARQVIGVLKHCPGGWPKFRKPEHFPLYGVVLSTHSRGSFHEWFRVTKPKSADFLLINKPGEKTT
jgi:hypothetical protein